MRSLSKKFSFNFVKYFKADILHCTLTIVSDVFFFRHFEDNHLFPQEYYALWNWDLISKSFLRIIACTQPSACIEPSVENCYRFSLLKYFLVKCLSTTNHSATITPAKLLQDFLIGLRLRS